MGRVWLLAQEGSVQVEFGSGENLALLAIMAVCLLALVVAFVLVREVLAADQGTEKMREIARAIQEGSRAYLNRQFRTLVVFVVLLFFLLLLLEADSSSVRIGRSVAFLVGAVFSALAGYTGMQLAVRANVRVAAAADEGGLLRAMPIAFRAGFSTGLESSVYAILAVIGAIVGAALFGSGDGLDFQLYMISLAGMGMLTTVGVVVSMDTFGPISDNAQGIAEMSGGVGERGNEVLTALDAVGNTTKAITKGVAIATAVLAATSLFGSFRRALIGAGLPVGQVDIPIDRPEVLVGLLIGGSGAVIFSAPADPGAGP